MILFLLYLFRRVYLHILINIITVPVNLSQYQGTVVRFNNRDNNAIPTHNHLVCKRAGNHLVKMTKWLSCVVITYLYGVFECMLLSYHVRVLALHTSDMVPASSKEFLDIQANYRVWICSETSIWHDNNLQSSAPYR